MDEPRPQAPGVTTEQLLAMAGRSRTEVAALLALTESDPRSLSTPEGVSRVVRALRHLGDFVVGLSLGLHAHHRLLVEQRADYARHRVEVLAAAFVGAALGVVVGAGGLVLLLQL